MTRPEAGELALAGTAVTTNQVVTRAQIDGNNLTFTPVAGESGDGYASFTFKVNDGIVDSDDAYTMTIDVTVTLFAPGPPTGLAATARGQSIDLAWTAPANTGGSPITGYRIEVSPDGTSDWTDLVADTQSTATTYSHTGLDAATTRHYSVSAINTVGTSVASGSDDATTEAATPAGVILVPLDWSKTPADIGAGERFRLMFASSTIRDATSTDIAVYNTFVRTLAAAAGLTAVQTYAEDFTALVSTESVNARANTQTRATDTDAPIYWVDTGVIDAIDRAADDYADFYDGGWQNSAGGSESGTSLHGGTGQIWTGTNTNGTTHATQFMGATGSSPTVLRWRPDLRTVTGADDPSTSHHILGLSPVFQVATIVNTVPTAADNTVTIGSDTTYTFAADDFGFDDTDTGDTLASVRIETLPAAGALALNGTTVTPDQVVTKADIDGNNLTFTPAPGGSGDAYASFTFRVNDGTYDSAVANTITFNVRDLSCAAPDFSGNGRRELWTGTVTTGVDEFGGGIFGYGFDSGIGSLTLRSFTIGSNSYTIESAFVSTALGLSEGSLAFDLANSPTTTEAGALELHVCDSAGFGFAGADVEHDAVINAYTWAAAALDWSPPVATRTLYLSLPANNPATGEPAITGTARVGQDLTADVTGIGDDDGLPGVFDYKWFRVDADGSSNETEITGEIASTYTLAAADVDKKVKVKVSFTDDLSGTEALTSEAYPASGTVTANTAPTAADSTVTTAENTVYTFTATDFGFVDADSDPLVSVKIETLPAADKGTLELSGTAVVADEVVPAASIGNLAYTPPADENGTGYASFTFKVSDGTDESAVANTMTIDVTAGNDPAVGEPTITGTAQVGRTLTAVTTGITDGDGLTSPTYTYQWIRVDGSEADISDENSSTYTLVDADLGKTIKVRVSFDDDGGNTETLTSAATATVTAAIIPPVSAGLVSNLNQVASYSPLTIKDNANRYAVAQGFTTGANSGGYTLTSIEIAFSENLTATQVGDLTASVWSDDGSGDPNAELFTLTKPATVVSATNSDSGVGDTANVTGNYALFTAPSGRTLAASTTYHMYVTGSDNANGFWHTTIAGETGTAGWSIADTANRRQTVPSVGNWVAQSVAMLIRVNGTTGGGTTTSSDATLSALALADASDDSAITISPVFASGTTSYTASVDNGVDVITITPAVNESNATVEYLDSSDTAITDADSVKAGRQVSLSEGANTIKVKVTAQDTTTTNTYTVVVTRAAAALVSNVGQAEFGNSELVGDDFAQPFTTGGNATGYTLTSIELNLDSLSSTSTPTVKLYRGSANGTEVATLIGPAMLDTDTVKNYTFTPSSTVTLFRLNTYWVVAEGDTDWVYTASTSEDATSATDWEIGDRRESRTASSTGSFTAGAGFPQMIRVNGTLGGIVIAANTAATGEPSISGTAMVGQVLTATTGTIADADGLPSSFTYQWVRVDADGTSNEADITDANSSTYALADDDEGKKIKVKVSFTDNGGNAETRTSGDYPTNGTVQASNTLVSNVGQSAAAGFSLASDDLAQSFTTGTNATGYTLTSIELRLDSDNSTATPTVKLYSGSANGTEVATLIGPAMLDASSTKNYAFTPSSTATLRMSTTYWVVAEGDADWFFTNSVSEDATPATGWEISDDYASRTASSTGSFATNPGIIFVIRVNGTLGGIVLSSDATLSALALADAADDSAIIISPVFASGTTSYTASVVNGVDEITVAPTVNESNATVEYLDSSDTAITDADSVKAGRQVSLSEGANTIKVKVRAQDATTTSTYTVVVTRAAGTNTAPTAANKTVTTAEDTAYTFAATDFGFVDADSDPLVSVKIVTLPTPGELALDGTAVLADAVVAKADIDDDKLIFTPVAGATGDPYATFTFKVNDGTDDSAVANTMTIDVTSSDPAITIVADRPTATGKIDWIHYTLSRGGDPAAALTVTVTFAGPASNDWSLDTTKTSQDVTFTAGNATAEQSIQLGTGVGNIGFSESATTSGTLTARLGAKTGYDTSDTDAVQVVVISDPAWVIKLADDAYRFTEDGGAQDIELVATAASADMPAPSLDNMDRSILKLALVSQPGTATSSVGSADYAVLASARYFPSSTCSADPDAGNALVCRLEVPFTPVDDAEAEPDETLTLVLQSAPFTNPAIHFQGPGPDRTVSSSAKTYTVTIVDDDFGVTGVTVTSTPQQAVDTYGAWEHIELSVSFNKSVTVTGAPTFTFDLGGTPTTAAYQGGSGTGTLVFSYQVMPGDSDSDGIAWAADALAGGAIVEMGGTATPTLTVAVQAALSGHEVDGTQTVSGTATVSTVAVTSTPLLMASGSTSADTYGVGETIEFTVTFSAAVTVTGDPQFAFSLSNPPDRLADYNPAASTATALVFRYTVLAADEDTDGIWVGDQSLTLKLDPDDRILTVSNSSLPASLTHDEQGTLGSHKVDGSRSAGVNNPPTADDNTVTTAEDTAYTFTAGDFGFVDADGDTLASVKIVTPPASGKGTLELSGTAVAADEVVPAASIGNLAYTPPADANGTGYASFTFKVSDGTDESAVANTMTIDVTPGNDPATGEPTITGTAQVGRTLTAVTTGILDADGLTSVTYTYQWIRANGTEADIASANSSTYTLDSADLGKTIKVKVTFTDDGGTPETLTSAATATVTAATITATCTGMCLVSNLNQVATTSAVTFGSTVTRNLVAQGFMTGASTGGYTLTSIEVAFSAGQTGTQLGNLTAGVWSDDGSGNPSAELFTLTKPASIGAATNSGGVQSSNVTGNYAVFTAPANTTLDRSTSYHMVLEGGSSKLWSTAIDGETGATGWSIANVGHRKETTPTSGNWAAVSDDNAASNAMLIRVNGTTGGGTPTNNAPVFSSSTVALDLAENTAADQAVGAAVTATDADGDTLAYTLGGADMASFGIVGTTGQIRTISGVSYDHEAKPSYTVTVTASDGTDSADATVTISITDVDEPPVAPATPTVLAAAGSNTSLTVSWTAPANAGKPDIDSYDVQYRASGAAAWTDGPQNVTTTTTTIASLTADTSYEAQVRATNDEGDSDWSDPPGSGRTNSPTNNAAEGAPTITGTAQVGQTLTAATTGITDADGLASHRIHLPVDPGGRLGGRHCGRELEHLHPGRRRRGQDHQGARDLHRRRRQFRDAHQRGDGDGGRRPQHRADGGRQHGDDDRGHGVHLHGGRLRLRRRGRRHAGERADRGPAGGGQAEAQRRGGDGAAGRHQDPDRRQQLHLHARGRRERRPLYDLHLQGQRRHGRQRRHLHDDHRREVRARRAHRADRDRRRAVPDRPRLDRPGPHRRLRHHRLQDRGLQDRGLPRRRQQDQLVRPRRRHREHRHHLRPHGARRRHHPPLPRLRHQRGGHVGPLRQRRCHHRGRAGPDRCTGRQFQFLRRFQIAFIWLSSRTASRTS